MVHSVPQRFEAQSMQIEFLGDYIHIDHGRGLVIRPDGMKAQWDLISDLCHEYGCGRVLVESIAPERHLDTISAFESGIEASAAYPGLAVAICFYDYEPDETSELFITAARNRGARVKFFSDKNAALRWLGVES